MQAALKAANRIAVDFTTYDFRNLKALYTTMRSDATASFISKVIDPTSADSQALQRRLKVISSGSVIASAAQPSAPDGSVTVLLFVDQRLRSLGASTGRLEQQRMQLVLKEINGAWLVDQAKITGAS